MIKDAPKEQTTKLQNTVEMKRDKRFPNTNILFMTVEFQTQHTYPINLSHVAILSIN